MEITFKKFYIPAANLGKENVLPDVHDNAYIRATVSLTEKIGKEDRKYIGQGDDIHLASLHEPRFIRQKADGAGL